MKEITQVDAFVFTPNSETPLGVFETAHNIRTGQWFTYTVGEPDSPRSKISFQEKFRVYPQWREKLGNVFVQRDRNGLVSAVKAEL